MATYTKLEDKVNNRKIQVESAIRDGAGKNIENNYAKQDGFYGGMGVGKSLATESIISDREIEDSEVACTPITFGPTGDGAEISDGISQFEYLEGNSQKWNQVIPIRDLTAPDGITIVNNGDGSYTISGQKTQPDGSYIALGGIDNCRNHKLFYQLTPVAITGLLLINASAGLGYTSTNIIYDVGNNRDSWGIHLTITSAFNSQQGVTIKPFMIDLTEVYGAGNEPTTVEEFKSKYPLDYYPYSAPSIISSKSYSIISKGKNQFEGLDTFTRVLPNTKYELSGITAGGYIQEYDANKNLIQTSTEITTTTDITLSANTYYVKIQATTYSNIMFYIAYETYNARYVEPAKQTIQLPNIELRSVGDVRDIAYSAGGGYRKVRVVDLGSLTWVKNTAGSAEAFTRSLRQLIVKPENLGVAGNLMCSSRYTIIDFNHMTQTDYSMSLDTVGDLNIYDTEYADYDAAQLRTALSGIYLFYELATPTEIPLSENPGWNSDILVNNYGTLEFTTNPTQLPQVEQPYLIKYSINLVDFLDSTYVRAEGDANKLALQSDMNEVKKDISDFKTGEQSVELAENLNSRMRLSENTPYLFRATGGALEVGSQCLENEIVGGSIVVNQWAQKFNSSATNTHVINTIDANEPILTITIDTTAPIDNALSQMNIQSMTSLPVGHKVLSIFRYNASKNFTRIRTQVAGFDNFFNRFNIPEGKSVFYGLSVMPATLGQLFSTHFTNPSELVEGDTLEVRLSVIDLTQKFGSQIANYIYSLEQANVGAGVAWVKQFLPKDYYEYTATPYFLNVKTTGKKVVGFNAYNNTTGTAKLLGGNQYQITGTYTSVSYVDINNATETLTIDANGKFTPTNNGVLTVVGGNATDTCVHLVWDGERDGEFETYREITYPTSDVELRGIPKLDSDNNLYYDGDKYKSDGTVVRRVAIIRLDELDYEYVEGDPRWQNYFKSTTQLSPLCRNVPAPIYYAKGVSNKYTGVIWGDFGGNNRLDKSITNNVSYVCIYDTAYNASTIEQFKNSLQGAYYLYETEDIIDTTETADAFTQKQQVDNWGTEEWIDSRTIPLLVGHNTEYSLNLKAKVEVSPESPETNGYYVLKREDGINTYYDLSSYLAADNYAKKEEIATTNLGTITTTTIVSNSFFRNNIAVSGGISVGDIVFVQMSNGAVYPTINNNATQLVIFNGSDLSALTITKVWKM